jgi:DNA excision repair protein ERCC-5
MLREELGWNQQKSDELLLPVIQRVNKRGAAAAANKQSNLETYFGDSIGSVGGSAIPRKRQAYTSKRLQKVVTDYREDQRRRSRTNAKGGASTVLDPDHPEDQFMEELDANGDLPEEFGQALDVGGSDCHGEDDSGSGSVKRTRKTSKSKAKTTAPTRRGTAGGKRGARKPSKNTTSTTSRSAKRKKRAHDSDDYDERADSDEVAPAPARPRPKPIRKKANTNTGPGAAGQERDG